MTVNLRNLAERVRAEGRVAAPARASFDAYKDGIDCAAEIVDAVAERESAEAVEAHEFAETALAQAYGRQAAARDQGEALADLTSAVLWLAAETRAARLAP